MSENKFTSIEQNGRKALFKKIGSSISVKRENVIKGIGDDAAVVKIDDFRAGVIASKNFIEAVDFDLTYIPFHHLGYKIVSATVSDIYAMNAEPIAMTMSLALPNRISMEMLDDFYKGVNAAGMDYNVQLSGGDLTGSRGYMAISISIFGESDINKIVYRSGAQLDDAVCVTGDVGSALAGLKVLLREKKYWQDSGEEYFEPDLTEYEYVVKKQLVPSARKDLIDIFEKNDILPTSMTSICQGLMNDFSEIIDTSNVGATIYEAALPIAIETQKVAEEMNDDVNNYALHGGEDYEMIFTLPKGDVEKLYKVYGKFTVIGKVTNIDDGLCMQTREGDVWRYK